jgi:hypothetical protein
MNHTVDEIIHWARRLFLIGPDPVDPAEAASFWGRIFPWPVRLLLVAAAALGAGWGSTTNLGGELAAALQYGGLVSVSVVASNWWILLAVNGVLAPSFGALFVIWRSLQSLGQWKPRLTFGRSSNKLNSPMAMLHILPTNLWRVCQNKPVWESVYDR